MSQDKNKPSNSDSEAVAAMMGPEPHAESLAMMRSHRPSNFAEGTTLEMLYRQVKASVLSAMLTGETHEAIVAGAIAIWDELQHRGELAAKGQTPEAMPKVNTQGAKDSAVN